LRKLKRVRVKIWIKNGLIWYLVSRVNNVIFVFICSKLYHIEVIKYQLFSYVLYYESFSMIFIQILWAPTNFLAIPTWETFLLIVWRVNFRAVPINLACLSITLAHFLTLCDLNLSCYENTIDIPLISHQLICVKNHFLPVFLIYPQIFRIFRLNGRSPVGFFLRIGHLFMP
jgi:hypothetical protein